MSMRLCVPASAGNPSRSSLPPKLALTARLCAALSCAALGTLTSANAASQTWSASAATADWGTASNWAGNAVPGATASTTNDIATFNTALAGGTIGGSGTPIVIDSGRRIGGITFDTASVGAYVIGSNAGNALTLSNNGNGTGTHQIQLTSTVATSQVVAAPILFVAPSSTNGIFGFVNNASSSAVNLSFTGTVTSSATRPAIILLDGTNTGNNAISGVMSYTGATQATPYLIKQGAGTWVISGANTFSGTPITSTNSNNGIQVLDGVLSLQNNSALGTSGTANQLQVWIGNKSTTYTYNSSFTKTYTSVSGGTLELANSITLDNGLQLNLFNGGTIRSSGSNATNGAIKLDTTAATSATLSTVGGGDVFTVGNGANDFTGGASDTVVHIAGPGTVLLSQGSNYAGSVSVDAGTLKLGSATALGSASTAAVAFGAGSTGKLFLNGFSPTITALSTNATVGTPVIENNNAAAATLTVSNTSGTSTYAGTLQNGATGTLALTKAGSGSTLVLSGNSNTYSGGTTISGGTLAASNSSGSATGTGSVSISSGGRLTGSGFITGATSVASGGIITPGTVTAGNAGSGVLTLGDLDLAGGSVINFGLVQGDATANYLSAATLTLPGSGTVTLNLYTPGTAIAFAAPGTYDLFQYTSLAGGSVSTAFSFGTSITGYNASFGTSGGYVQLTLTAAGVIGTWTNGNANGNWSDAGNWSGGVPSSAGDVATFSSAPGTVNLDVNETVGGLTFNNASPYTISGAHTLTLDNSGSGASVTVSAGSEDIQSAVALNDNVGIATAAGTQLTISGAISQASGTRSLTKTGTGTLVLSSTSNTYSGGTSVDAGTLTFSGLGSLGTGTTLGLGSASTNGTLKYEIGNTADISGLTVTLNAGGGTIDTNGNNVTFVNPIGNSGSGALTKAGLGTLTLAGANTYTGTTTVNAGTLSVSSNANLGDPATGASVVLSNGGTLETTATFALDNSGANNRGITLNGGSISADAGTTFTISGLLTGSGGLNLTGPGTVSITNTGSSFTGGVTVTGGTFNLGADVNFGTGGLPLSSGTVTLIGGTLAASETANNTLVYDVTNPIATSGTSTINTPSKFRLNSAVSGSGTLNMTIASLVSRADFQNDFSGFNGTLVVTGSGTARIGLASLGSGQPTFNSAGLANTTLSLDGVSFTPTTNSGGNTMTIGALTSAGSTGTLSGGSAGAVTYSIGGKNVSTAFGGTITGNANLTKTGTATLTLTGANAYTGLTTISAGTLQLGDGTSGNDGTIASTSGITNNASLVYNRFGSASSSVAISGSGSVTKIGAGTQTLTGSNSYAGGTSINAGTLNTGASGTNLGSGDVIVGGGALTLNATGIGNLTGITNFTMNTGSTSFDIASLVSFDSIAGTGAFAINGGTIVLSGTLVGDGTDSYAIFSGFTGNTVGSFTFDTSGLANLDGRTAVLSNTGVLSFTAVPEPGEYGLTLAGLLFVMIACRRRRMRQA